MPLANRGGNPDPDLDLGFLCRMFFRQIRQQCEWRADTRGSRGDAYRHTDTDEHADTHGETDADEHADTYGRADAHGRTDTYGRADTYGRTGSDRCSFTIR